MTRSHAALFDTPTRTDTALNVILVLSLVLATGSVAYALVIPPPNPSSEFYLLTKNGSTLTADDYPQRFTKGEPESLTVAVENHEGHEERYTVLVKFQQMRFTNNTSINVIEETELHRFRFRLRNNETWMRSHTITPSFSGERLRLVYLLYRSPIRSEIDEPYATLTLWIRVSDDNVSSSIELLRSQ